MRNYPHKVYALLGQNGLTDESILFSMVCDRSVQGGFLDSYVFLSKDRLVIVREEPDEKRSIFKTFKGYISNTKQQEVPAIESDSYTCESWRLADIESLSVVNLIASGMLVVKTTEEKAIAAFTNGFMSHAAKLTDLFNKLKNDERIEPGDTKIDDEAMVCPKCGMMYPEKGRQICPRCVKKHAIFFRLLSFAKGYKASIFFIVLFMLLNSAIGLVIPYFQGTVLFDQALGNTGTFAGKIGLVILIIIISRTLSMLCAVVFSILNARLAAGVVFDLKANVFSALQRLSLSFFQSKQTGQLMTRVNNDATDVQNFFVDGITYFIVNTMNIIGVAIILLVMDWKLTLISFIPLPFVVLLVRMVLPRLWRLSWKRYRGARSMNSLISDTISGTRVVKAFGKEHKEMDRFQKVNFNFANAQQMYNRTSSTVFPLITMVTQFAGIIIWAIGGWKVMHGEFTFGKIMTFINYIVMLYGPIQFMNNIIGWWSNCMSAAQRIFEIQDSVPEVQEKIDPVKLKNFRGDIEVAHVTYGYEPNKPVLKDVSMEVHAGQMIGVIGRSGAGKSTLVNLISRLYDIAEGEILIDGVNIKDLELDTLREHIGIVSQDVYVFMGSIAENIAYANPDCSLEEIIEAAKIANAHDFIEKLPEGYDTIVGTGGYRLSGGERQRISIARAILHNPKILILDEATASLDTETELQIQEALETLIEGRTTIAIAHRLSTLRNADYLLVMDKGCVVEQGTHDDLMRLEGMYRELVRKHDEALKMKGVG